MVTMTLAAVLINPENVPLIAKVQIMSIPPMMAVMEMAVVIQADELKCLEALRSNEVEIHNEFIIIRYLW